jgi:tRNA pseudouridine synthase 10
MSDQPAPQDAPRPSHPLPKKPKVRLFFEGRYRKFVRDLPQTVFYCPECKGGSRREGCEHCKGRGKLTDDSVQELIARQLLPRFRAREGIFHGAGREDLDVRMLGPGRPFVYEIVSPRIPDVDVEAAVATINELHKGRIEVTPLKRVERRRVGILKEARFDKVYGALVGVTGPIPAERLPPLVGARVEIEQRTPDRVAHRRADLVRKRVVTVRALDPVDANRLRAELRCDHGTYVKEWISGDNGRTHPSLADLLGVPCACLELDVLDVIAV